MNFFQKAYIKTIKCFIVPCEKASFLMTKKDFQKLTFKEGLDLRLHLIKCKYCRWLEDEQALISEVLIKNKNKIEDESNTEYAYTLSPEKIEELKKIVKN